jgi:hypothetical protein
MKNSYKTILALSTIGLVGAGSLAFAQTAPTTTTSATDVATTQARPTPPEFANLTTEQKAVMEQARTLFESGKRDEAKTLLDNAGIKMPERGGKGMHGNMQAVDDAIVAGDYTAFKTAATNGPLANIDQATFNSLKSPVEAKRAAETQIQTILKNAGVTMPTPGQAPTATSN